MSSSIGKLFRLTSFGESHGKALGGVVDGFPPGVKIDEEFIKTEMGRRRPGSTTLGTARDEGDDFQILSGVYQGYSTGAPIAFIVQNKNQISADYEKLKDVFRPSHADYTYFMKYGIRDERGGGRASGRETLSRVFAGSLAKLYLKEKGISINAAVIEVGGIKAEEYQWSPPFYPPLYAPENAKIKEMEEAIKKARDEGDSVGGVIKCVIKGVPAGLGEPVFDKADALLSRAVLSIGAVKAIEFGSGFQGSGLRGSENNDQMEYREGKTVFLSNNAGGIVGGITNGEDIVFSCAVKPTSSISKEQHTIDKNGESVLLKIEGRHDPCIAPRAVVVVEAMAAITILDLFLVNKAYG